jgi:hypothetical protein
MQIGSHRSGSKVVFLIIFAITAIIYHRLSATPVQKPATRQTAQCKTAKTNTVKLSGKVTDTNGTPLSNTEVSVLPDCKCASCPDPGTCSCCPDQFTVMTDDKGFYKADVQPGKYSLKVHDTKQNVKVGETDKTANIKANMSKSQM